jgi:hypothetical protein
MIEVTSARYLDEYKIWIEFNDGTAGVADLHNVLWGQIFEPLKDRESFKNFKISKIMNTIEWENGADLAPEFLYEKVKIV